MILVNSAISTTGLVIGIGGNLIAKSDDLSLEQGKVLVLVGKNGSGKSTYLRTLGGILKPMAGEITFDGHKQSEIKIEKTAAWLSQEEHLEFSWTVREYVSLGRIAQNSGLKFNKDDESAVDEALADTDCQTLSSRSVHELSGGERQRVRFARSLAQQTPIILMDEPTTHLDIEHQIQVLELIVKLANQGKTIVVSLHDVVQAKKIGSQFLLFQDSIATKSDNMTKKLLEQTLGVHFEQSENGNLFPIYLCHTTDH